MSWTTLGDLFERSCVAFGERRAYAQGDSSVSFSELGQRVNSLAAGLIATDLRPGERVAIWATSTVDWIVTYMAVAMAGGVVVPVNGRLTSSEVSFIVRQSEAEYLVAGGKMGTRDLAAEAVQLAAEIGAGAPTVVQLSGDAIAGVRQLQDVLAAGAHVTRDELRSRAGSVRLNDPLMVLYTSGTTGSPKGVVHSHACVANMVDVAERLGLQGTDTLVLYLPFFHIYALVALVGFMWVGGSVVVMEHFDAAESLAEIARRRATVVYGVGTHYYDQLRILELRPTRLENVRFCLAPGTPDQMRAITRHIGTAVNVYGMTETTGIATLGTIEDPPERRINTAGRPLPSFDLKVIDQHGVSCPPEVSGEVLVRGPAVTRGYNGPGSVLKPALDIEGWLHTGDLGWMTADGYLVFAGRLADGFRVGGENVDPAEIEQVVAQHPAVDIVSVVGVPDDRLGSAAAAFARLRPGAELVLEELREFCRPRLASYKVPRHLVIVDRFPLSASGKVQKSVLQLQFQPTAPGDSGNSYRSTG